jgi:secreted trypsin-like serine protease
VVLLAAAACSAGPPHDPPQPLALLALVNHSAPAGELFNGQFCGAVAISPHEALTARHCLTGRRATTIDVVVSPASLCAHDRRATRVHVTAAEGPAADGGYSDDVAVLHLDGPALRTAPVDALPAAPALVAWGWGRTGKLGTAPCLADAVRLGLAPASACGRGTRTAGVRWNPRTAFCARPLPRERRNTCTGDSGGPVLSGTAVVGVISWGPDSRPTSIGGYMRATDAADRSGWRALP